MSVKRFLSFGGVSKRSVRRLRLLGDVAQSEREWSKAGEFYRKYLSHRPNDAPIWVQLGHGLKELKRFDEAEKAYRNALSAVPGDIDAQVHLVALLNSLGKQNDALMLGLAPAHPQVPSVNGVTAPVDESDWGDRRQGDIARDQKDWNSAALSYSQHLTKHSHDGAIWVQLGHMLKECLLFEEALYAYQVGKRLDRETSDVSLHLASLLMHMERSEEAKPLWASMFQKEKSFFLHTK